jgi:hypothetical protein
VRARTNTHLLDRFDATRMERWTIRVVVHFGDVLIDLLDEVGPDIRHGKRIRRRVTRPPGLLLK